MINYKQLLADLASIAYHHEQIKSFGFGDITQCTNDIETKVEPQYTRMYVVPGTVELPENQIAYNISIIIMDRIEEDMSNLKDVMSDTLEICMDVWTVFWQSYTAEQGNFSYDLVADWEPSITPFTERFQTVLGGWTINLRIVQPFDYNSCVLPIATGFTFPQDETYSSYYQILNDWQQFAIYHEQINSYGFGDVTQLINDIETKKEPLYPRIYFVPDVAKISPNHMHINYKIIICDRLEDDLSNLQDVMSDCLEIAKDFFAKSYLSDYDAEWGATCEPFVERTETILGGWTLSLNIQQKFDYNRCVLPIKSFVDNLTWEEVMELWRNVNRDWEDV